MAGRRGTALGVAALLAVTVSLASPALAQEDTVPPDEVVTTLSGATTSILSTTTTKPPECKDLLPLSVVFVGTVIGTAGTTARFAVAQIRQGELPATRVSVEYPDDIRFVKEGSQYVVGAAVDPATNLLVSKVRPSPDQPDDDPCIERDPVYTTQPRRVEGRHRAVQRALRQGLVGGLGLRAADAHRARAADGAGALQASGNGGVPAVAARSRRSTSAIAASSSGTGRSVAAPRAEQNTSIARATASPVTRSHGQRVGGQLAAGSERRARRAGPRRRSWSVL